MTTHDCSSWNTYRATLISLSHEVDNVGYVGGRGQRLDVLLEASYVEEAHQLGSDLAELLGRLPAPMATQVLDGMKGALGHAAGQRHDIRPVAVTMNLADVSTDPDATGVMAAEPEPEPAPEGNGRRRNRRNDDAAAALDEHRGGDTGEVVAAVDG